MKKGLYCVFPILLIVVLMTGCGADRNTSSLQNPTTGDTVTHAENGQTKDEDSQESDLDENEAENTDLTDDLGEDISYTYNEISITFPASWEKRYVIREHDDDNGFSVLQKASDDKNEGWGFLFSIYSSDTPYIDAPGAYALSYTKDKIYYFGTPTDVPYDCEDEEVAKDYELLQQDLEQIKASIVIDVPQIHTNASEYVFPMSEYYPLTEDMLLNMGENDLWLARNEIYARHGYHFKNGYLQSYFEKYAWYEDRGDSFSEDEFSQIEKDNVSLFKKMEDKTASQSLYPLEEKVGKKVSADLSGNGIPFYIR